ncbi:FAD-dependent oxidoreductase [Reyranella sp. CPCC 100927]|uniref:FAD-dependent oxidoreductase n=1 Tax=Reyranella sp. CPCC 100927 TaxID=2599616 RepID=UPI0011B4B4B0|nr:FAD-dependent oxidoreductase [Reyranella sp. CPCC 100927]TWT12952.1 FAD-dependent oxidoreductase [Reyranella sp. CPCC 100927]
MTLRLANGGALDEILLDVEGQALAARSGESLAAALTAAGIHSFRDTKGGGSRGLFCGMGVCHDCLVRVDETDNRRACMTKVTGQHAVRRQTFPGRLPAHSDSLAPITIADLAVRKPDVLVIGGGAGGLSAAIAAAEAGAGVVLLDERAQSGGQYYKQPAEGRPRDAVADAQVDEGQRLVARARRAGVEILCNAEAWGAFAPMTIGATTPQGSLVFQPRRLIVAAGAYERGLPVPGWTLPGVMTTGAAQTLLKTDGVLAGRRILICGNGPLNLQIALELARAGATVVAVAELAEAVGVRQAGTVLRMLRHAPRLAWQGARMTVALRRRGIPVLSGRGLVRVEPYDGALRATLGRRAHRTLSPERDIVVDVVLMGYGFMPSNELLLALGCRHDFDATRGHLVTARNAQCETSVTGVYGVGDCCGLGGAKAACEEGWIAGADAARALGRSLPPAVTHEVAAARARLAQHRDFQAALWQLFAAPRWNTELAQPDTLICRCEEVPLGAIEAAMADGTPDIGEIKRRTRLGMGRCQGRYCAPLLASLLAERRGRPIDAHAFFAPRAPAKPVAIKDLVRAASAPPP